MRSHLVRHAALLLVSGAIIFTAPRMVAQSPVDARERQLFVTVLDKSGSAVKDLSAGDFVVREDNELRKVTAARLATDTLSVAMVVDSTKEPLGTDATTQDLRRALASFVSAVQTTAEDTAISLTECAGAVATDVSLTTKGDDLRAAITHIIGGRQSGAVLLDALLDASKRLSQVASPRRVIVSVDFDSSAEASEAPPSTVIQSVHGAGASLWALSIQRTGVPARMNVDGVEFAPLNGRETLLGRLPDLTGGEHLHAVGTSSLDATLLRLADVLTHQYLVTYIRPYEKPVTSITAASPRGVKTLMAPWVR